MVSVNGSNTKATPAAEKCLYVTRAVMICGCQYLRKEGRSFDLQLFAALAFLWFSIKVETFPASSKQFLYNHKCFSMHTKISHFSCLNKCCRNWKYLKRLQFFFFYQKHIWMLTHLNKLLNLFLICELDLTFMCGCGHNIETDVTEQRSCIFCSCEWCFTSLFCCIWSIVLKMAPTTLHNFYRIRRSL